MKSRKGIILAGGSGTRLHPVTLSISKQLLPIYDKPMVYYPLSVLMLAGIREIAIITTPDDQGQFVRLLGDGEQWGLSLSYIVQPRPDGLAQAYVLAEEFLDGAASAMVLGDNLFFGQGLSEILSRACAKPAGGTVLGYRVSNPECYGVADFDAFGRLRAIIEKPEAAPSSYAVTGLYFLDDTAPTRARRVRPSVRGEMEITSLLASYIREGALDIELLGRGFAWLDAGTHGSLLEAGNFVRTLAVRQGVMSGCPEEIAFGAGWIGRERLAAQARKFAKTDYGKALMRLLEPAAGPVAGRAPRFPCGTPAICPHASSAPTPANPLPAA